MMPPVSAADRIRSALRELPRAIGYRRGPLLMSELRRRWVLLRHPHADIRFDGPVYLGPGFSLHVPHGGRFVVGPNVEFRRGFRAEVEGEGRIAIGAGSVFTYSVLMQCTTSIDVGERCIFAQSAIVVDGQHRFRDLERPVAEQGFDFRPVRIGDDALILSKSTIMADVGRRAVVGANAVVTKPVPDYCVAVGVPARVVEYFGPPGGEPPAD
jgi:acetyltransferase-like isoleucine patch superfamily enzyme